MQTLQIDDELATVLVKIAKTEHIKPEQLIKKLITDYAKNKKPVMMATLIDDLPSINAFKDNPVDIQHKMRNEWKYE